MRLDELVHGTYAKRILREHVRLLFSNQVTALLVNVLVAGIFSARLWGHVELMYLLKWQIILLTTLLVRGYFGHRYLKKSSQESVDPDTWLSIYMLLMAFSGLTWGLGGIWFAQVCGVEIYNFTAFVLGGLVVGSISTAGIVFRSYVVYLVTTLFPITVFFLFEGSHEVVLMGCLLIAYITIMTAVAKKYGATYNHSLLLQSQKEDMITSLEATQKELKHSEQRFKDIAMSSADFIWEIDLEFNYSYVSGKVEAMLGYTADELIGTSPFNYLSTKDVDVKKAQFADLFAKQRPIVDFETWHVAKDGNLICVRSNGVPIINDENQMIGYRGVNKDVTSQKELYERMEHLATHDMLTGLYNRRILEEQLDMELRRCVRYGRELSVVMVDIDHFKDVNDTYGHGVGDNVLKQVADIMAGFSRRVDIVTRVGGEEFIILLPETPLAGAQLFTERLRERIEQAVFVSDTKKRIPITVSLGLATVPMHADSKESVLLAVDKALYEAKETGRNKVCLAEAKA